MTDDFSNHPVSIASVKATKQEDGKLWTPRDALIDVLRDIDSGKYELNSIVICILKKGKTPDKDIVSYVQSSRSRTESLGMLSSVEHLIHNP